MKIVWASSSCLSLWPSVACGSHPQSRLGPRRQLWHQPCHLHSVDLEGWLPLHGEAGARVQASRGLEQRLSPEGPRGVNHSMKFRFCSKCIQRRHPGRSLPHGLARCPQGSASWLQGHRAPCGPWSSPSAASMDRHTDGPRVGGGEQLGGKRPEFLPSLPWLSLWQRVTLSRPIRQAWWSLAWDLGTSGHPSCSPHCSQPDP